MKPLSGKLTRKKRPKPEPKKAFQKARSAERTVKSKSLADFLDQKIEEAATPSPFTTIAQPDLVCPHCGWRHEAEDFGLSKQSTGTVKCSDCGQGFGYEMRVTRTYSTMPE